MGPTKVDRLEEARSEPGPLIKTGGARLQTGSQRHWQEQKVGPTG